MRKKIYNFCCLFSNFKLFIYRYKLIQNEVKNIIFPLISDFSDRYFKSLEEFEISGEVTELKDIYYKLKNSKSRYRVSLDDLVHLKFYSCFSRMSKVKHIYLTLPQNS